MKKYIADNNINFYTIDAIGIAKKLGLGNKTSIVLQSAFFKISNVIPFDDAVGYMKDAVVKSFGAKGEKIVNMNHAAITEGSENIHKVNVPDSWRMQPKKWLTIRRIFRISFARSRCPATLREAISLPFPSLWEWWTAICLRAQPHMKREVSLLTFRFGMLQNAYSVTSARRFARTPL